MTKQQLTDLNLRITKRIAQRGLPPRAIPEKDRKRFQELKQQQAAATLKPAGQHS
jgi:hypothetical protein